MIRFSAIDDIRPVKAARSPWERLQFAATDGLRLAGRFNSVETADDMPGA